MAMKNKVLIKLYVPSLDSTFDIFVPVNEYIWKINILIAKSISDLTEGSFLSEKRYILFNTETGKIYNPNDIIINTDIRNSTVLSLIELK